MRNTDIILMVEMHEQFILFNPAQFKFLHQRIGGTCSFKRNLFENFILIYCFCGFKKNVSK